MKSAFWQGLLPVLCAGMLMFSLTPTAQAQLGMNMIIDPGAPNPPYSGRFVDADCGTFVDVAAAPWGPQLPGAAPYSTGVPNTVTNWVFVVDGTGVGNVFVGGPASPFPPIAVLNGAIVQFNWFACANPSVVLIQ